MWNLNESAGELLVKTGVSGRAARMGHRLLIAMQSWQAEVRWAGDEPSGVDVTVEVDSLQVVRGEGGVKGLSEPEKTVVRSNALKALDANRFRQIRFQANDIQRSDTGFRLGGTLEIHGQTRERVVDVQLEDLGDAWRITCDAEVRQSDFGVKPYSILLGSVSVADTVTVSFDAQRAKDGTDSS
ncbi:MAG: YceI family protein [Mycobacterium sp.]|nr:YceI family protein [Mycobacterium sp.]